MRFPDPALLSAEERRKGAAKLRRIADKPKVSEAVRVNLQILAALYRHCTEFYPERRKRPTN